MVKEVPLPLSGYAGIHRYLEFPFWEAYANFRTSLKIITTKHTVEVAKHVTLSVTLLSVT